MLKLNYVTMCQEKARKQKKTKVNANRRETIKGILGLSAFLVVAGIVGRMDYNVEMAQAKGKSAIESTKETVVSMSTVRRVYGITMDNGSTIYAMENDGNIHSWYIEDASEMQDYTPVQLVYDTMGTDDMSDDEVINVIPVESNSDTKTVLEYVFEGGE